MCVLKVYSKGSYVYFERVVWVVGEVFSRTRCHWVSSYRRVKGQIVSSF